MKSTSSRRHHNTPKTTSSKRHRTTRKIPDKNQIFGPEKTRAQVMAEIMAAPDLYRQFQKLSPTLQDELVEFAMGVRGLNVTYDPVFKTIFNPETRRERLEEFLSLCMKQKVRILRALPNESQRLTEEGSLLVMDILVQLRSGELVNVEIQRIGYAFPGARCACYSSDLLMRQYSQVREARRKQEKQFNYKDIKGVYTIVLVQQSTPEFWQYPEDFLHYFKQTSSTGLNVDLLQKYLLIPLDIFRESLHNRRRNQNTAGSREPMAEGLQKRKTDSRNPHTGILRNKLEAWLTFIASDRPEDIMEVIRAYPEFQEPYKEVFAFRYQQRELISMYSKALAILDANTVEYMVEQQRKEILELKEALKNRDKALEDKEKALKDKYKALTEVLKDRDKALTETSRKLEVQQKEIEQLKALLQTSQIFRSDS